MKSYIAVIGTVDENTTEEVVLKEIAIAATDHFQAHKAAFYKCIVGNKETVFFVREADTRKVKYDYKKGFLD
jgi:predicted nucleic-acid-binding protein